MNSKIVTVFILGLLLLPLMNAAVELTFPFNSEFNLKRPCFNNGTFCSATSECNITLISPNSNTLVDNQVMTNQIAFHNYTVVGGSNVQLGIISATMVCIDGAVEGSDTFEIAITGSGVKSTPFPIELSLIILGFVGIVVGAMKERLSLLKSGGSILIMVMGVVTLFPGYAEINYTTLSGLTLGTILIGLGFYFLIEGNFSRKVQEDSYDQDNKEEIFDDD